MFDTQYSFYPPQTTICHVSNFFLTKLWLYKGAKIKEMCAQTNKIIFYTLPNTLRHVSNFL